MIDILIYGLILLALLSFVFPLVNKTFGRNKLGIEGKLIWVDKGPKTKPFFNQVFEVLGKPDLMYKIKGGVLAVEYKTRNGAIYQSDIVQAKTAALAARGEGYKVIRILIKTGAKEQYINLPSNDRSLFDEVRQFIDITRGARRGATLKAWPNKYKCRSCAFLHSCSHSKA